MSGADAGFLVHGKAHRDGVDGVAHGQLVVLKIHVDDLAIGVGGRRGHAYANVAGENVVLVVVKLGIHVNALAFLERKLRGLRAIVEDVRALVKVHAPVAAAKNMHGHAVAQAINAGDSASDQRGGGARHGRRIKDGVVTVSG